MTVPELLPLFLALQVPEASEAGQEQYAAEPIPGYAGHRVARDSEGQPAILLSVAAASRDKQSARLTLENLTVRHDVQCRIVRSSGNAESGCFTILKCTSHDELLHMHFLRVLGPVLAALGAMPSGEAVSRSVDLLAELFRAVGLPPRKPAQGLWAEMFLIARSSSVSQLVAAWHVDPSDRYDFNDGSQRIEVKSYSMGERRHHFTLDQLHPPEGCLLLIASIATERAGGGTSLTDLCDEIRAALSGDVDLLLHLDRTVGLSLGEAWRRAAAERFDRERAEESLAFFEPCAVPSVCPDVPPGVTDVRFRSDLTGRPPADVARYQTLGGIFGAALR